MRLNDKCHECGCTRDLHVDANALNRTGKLDLGPCTRCTCQQFVEPWRRESINDLRARLLEEGARLRQALQSPITPEPPPVNRDDEPDVADLVIEDIRAKKAAGIEKYGVPLRARNGRRAIVDLYQELIDAAHYVRQLIQEEEEGPQLFVVGVTGNPTVPGLWLHNLTRHSLQPLLQLRDAGVVQLDIREQK